MPALLFRILYGMGSAFGSERQGNQRSMLNTLLERNNINCDQKASAWCRM